MKHGYITRTSLWIARIWGTLILVFVLYMLIAHLFDSGKPIHTGLNSPKELLTFLCFPVLTLLGLAMAYKWEALGGLISSLALIFAMILNQVLDLKFFLLIFPPGFIYLIYWHFSKKEKRIAQRMKLH